MTERQLSLLEPSVEGQVVANTEHRLPGRKKPGIRRIISASKRTDIPAFYLKEMVRWCRQGWVDVRNPYFGPERPEETPEQRAKRSTHVSLLPEDVIAIVWWSKNYAVYERLQGAFTAYPVQYFNFTINPRRQDLAWLEPDVPPLEEALRQVDALRRLPGGGEMIAWRYDPLVFWEENGRRCSSWDPDFFELMGREMARLGVRRVITSVADPYLKFKQRLRLLYPERLLRQPTVEELRSIMAAMQQVATAFDLDLVGCSEPELEPFAVPHGACIDGALLRARSGDVPSLKRASDVHSKGRETCGCAFHTDIGNYESHECGYACLYCYANPNHRRFKKAGGIAIRLPAAAQRTRRQCDSVSTEPGTAGGRTRVRS